MLFITQHFEQEWNAERLSELGYGNCINENPEKFIAEKIEALFESGNGNGVNKFDNAR
jgi:UDP:flavonoid glycosyltransferase YjiC (YdhE family)